MAPLGSLPAARVAPPVWGIWSPYRTAAAKGKKAHVTLAPGVSALPVPFPLFQHSRRHW